MSNNAQQLERFLDAITDDIFNDIEYAKAVINEAGYDAEISLQEGRKRIAQLQDETGRKVHASFVYENDNCNSSRIQSRIQDVALTITDSCKAGYNASDINSAIIGCNSANNSRNDSVFGCDYVSEDSLQLN